MRRILICAAALLLAVLLCACGKNEEQHTSEEFGLESSENVGEAEETAAMEPEEAELGNEDETVWYITGVPSVEESEDWNPRSVRRRRNGNYKDGFRSAVRQGNSIYLAYENRLAKMPVDGNIDDVEVLLDREFAGKNRILEIQVVGEWIYIRTNEEAGGYYNVNSLWRVRTDGTGLERLTSILAADDSERNTFAVIGNQLYLSCMASERRSATEYFFTSVLYCYQLDTGTLTELYRTSSTDSDMNLIIFCYNDKSLLLMDFSQDEWNPAFLIYEYGADAPFAMPEALQELIRNNSYCVIYDDMTETGSYLAENNEILYRISPENGYVPEELPIRLFTAEEDAKAQHPDYRQIDELLVLDGETFIYSYWIQWLGSGMRLYQNGTLTDINGDEGVHLDYPGDGYLYYSYSDKWDHYHHCRTQLDGTGWEQLDWEYISATTATTSSYG